MISKKTVEVVLLAAVLAAALAMSLPATSAQTERVTLIEIDGEIQAGTAQFIKRAVAQVRRQAGGVLIIELSTPGGLLRPTEEIVEVLLEDKVRSVVFVPRAGSSAFSAGSFILLAADVAAVHPNASIGAAQPRLLGADTLKKPDQKIIEATRSWMKSIAQARSRPLETATSFVTDNVTLTGSEALAQGLINLTPSSRTELLKQLGLEDAELARLKPSFIEEILSLFALPQVVSLLFSVGALGLILAFRTGDFGAMGALALIAVLLGLWGFGSITINTLGAALVTIGIVLIAWELVNPGVGAAGIIGAVGLILGVLTFGKEPLQGQDRFLSAIDYFAIGAGLAMLGFFVILSRGVYRAVLRKPQTGPESLAGQRGVVSRQLSPLGRIKIDSESWRARSSDGEDIPAGATVEVVRIEGNTAVVKQVN